MGLYRVEVSPSARAKCHGGICNKQQKIQKGELRLGTWLDPAERGWEGHPHWEWKHWGEVTPKILDNIRKAIYDDLEALDGFGEFDEEYEYYKKAIRRAFEQGHVDDEDWRGDPDFNRPGKRGMGAPRKRAEKVEENDSDKENQEYIPESQPKPKRGRKKASNKLAQDDDDVIIIESEPEQPKQQKKVPKKTAKKPTKKTAQADDGYKPKRGRGRPRKVVEHTADESPKKDNGVVESKPSAQDRKRKVEDDGFAENDNEANEEADNPKKKARKEIGKTELGLHRNANGAVSTEGCMGVTVDDSGDRNRKSQDNHINGDTNASIIQTTNGGIDFNENFAVDSNAESNDHVNGKFKDASNGNINGDINGNANDHRNGSFDEHANRKAHEQFGDASGCTDEHDSGYFNGESIGCLSENIFEVASEILSPVGDGSE